MANKLSKLNQMRREFDSNSQDIIDSLNTVDKEIGQLNNMKSTAGWKILDKKIREELKTRIFELIKEDVKVQTLISFLQTAETKTKSRILEDEINKALPDE